MREVYIDLSSDNYLQQPSIFGGYAGEHRETVLRVKLPERMINIECSGYRFDFQTSDGNKILSPLIPVSELDNNTASFYLTEQLTVEGKLLFNISAVQSNDNDENTVYLIAKTNVVVLYIKSSTEGNNVLPDPNGYKDELFKMVDERIREINPANVDQTYDPASANAQSGIAVAEAIAAQPKQIPEITSLELSDKTPLGVYILKANSKITYVSQYDEGITIIPFSDIKVSSDTLINVSRISTLAPSGMSRYGIRVMFLSEVTEFDSVVPIKRTLGYIEYWKESSSSTGYPATGTITYYNYATTTDVAEAISDVSTSKVDKEDGKGLSTNDFTDDYKSKLDGIQTGAEANVQSDWTQNDETANDYIKNRPGGYVGLTEILPETTLDFTDSKKLYLTNCPLIEVGVTYAVTFDGTEYELVGRNDSEGMGLTCIGNESRAWGGTDTGEPFIIFNENLEGVVLVPSIWISSPTTLPYNIKIEAVTPVKIDEKYLDIKNTNIVNGSAAGSLRTRGSTEENSSYSMGLFAFAEGQGTKASGSYSHAEGYYTTASGFISHAEGEYTIASGFISHAEGSYTKASGEDSHAEGVNSTALGNYSHAEGRGTTAHGAYSHAEGELSETIGKGAHAEGYYTQSSSNYQHVQGKYNIIDDENKYADIIGNGSSDTGRSNAYTLDWNGNAWYAGDVYVGSTSGTNKDAGSKKLATEEYVDTGLTSKVDKEDGKQLSTNDFTDDYKTKLDGIELGANKTIIDSELSDTSTNPVQNKIINAALGDINTALDRIIALQNSYIGGNA